MLCRARAAAAAAPHLCQRLDLDAHGVLHGTVLFRGCTPTCSTQLALGRRASRRAETGAPVAETSGCLAIHQKMVSTSSVTHAANALLYSGGLPHLCPPPGLLRLLVCHFHLVPQLEHGPGRAGKAATSGNLPARWAQDRHTRASMLRKQCEMTALQS